ncbi:MAG: DUF2784 domain-containing protein [Caulobacteraceae bacterium]
MAAGADIWLAEAVLALHLAVIGFNLFGLVAVPLGAWRGWRFVRVAWWRWPHLASMAAVAVQALAGRACILTLAQDALLGRAERTPMIAGFVDRLIYWPLPLWVFAAAYAVLFAYAIALMVLVPPRRSQR